MDKQALKMALLKMEQNHVEMLEADYYDFIKENLLKRDEVIDTQDQSHHRESVTISNALDKEVHKHSKHLEVLSDIQFNASTKVEPGAVVRLNDKYLVIATADGKFEFDGKEFMSISTEAPIYQCLKEKKTNDVCTFDALSFRINEIY